MNSTLPLLYTAAVLFIAGNPLDHPHLTLLPCTAVVPTDQTPILSFAHLTRRLSTDTATDRVEAAPIPPYLEKREREYPRPLKRTASASARRVAS